ncbi:MAG TPA: hypothetical protein DHV96_14415 [Lachnospiraceae bacterium]|nr:hypothetical protein [Lachnospiraceae bacterium]
MKNISIISIIAIIFISLVVPIQAKADEDLVLEYDCFTYQVYGDHIKLTSYHKPEKLISGLFILPETIEGLPVTEMADGLFADSGGKIFYVYIPKTITKIPDNAFRNCNALRAIVLPDTITSIGDHAFEAKRDYNGKWYDDGIQDVFFYGSADEWDAVTVGTGNDRLLRANIHCDRYAESRPFSFTFGEDNWSFTNNDMERYGFRQEALDAYLGDCGSSVRSRFQELVDIYSDDTVIYQGICGGMAVSSYLAACGILDPSDIYPGAKTLHDIPLCDEALDALMFYWTLDSDTASFRPEMEGNQMLHITSDHVWDYLGDAFQPGVVGWMLTAGTHATVAYGTERGEWEYYGRKYTGRILIYDNNAPGFSDEHCIYVAEDGEMLIPRYGDEALKSFCVYPSPEIYTYSIGNRTPYTSSYSLGDPDASGEANAADASSILAAAAASGLDQATGMNFGQLKSADINGDGEINAVDASLVLCYTAETGLGTFSGTLNEFLDMQMEDETHSF